VIPLYSTAGVMELPLDDDDDDDGALIVIVSDRFVFQLYLWYEQTLGLSIATHSSALPLYPIFSSQNVGSDTGSIN